MAGHTSPRPRWYWGTEKCKAIRTGGRFGTGECSVCDSWQWDEEIGQWFTDEEIGQWFTEYDDDGNGDVPQWVES